MTSDTDKTKSSDFVFDPPLLPLDDNFALPPPIIQTYLSKKIMKKYYSYTPPSLYEKKWKYAEARCINVHSGHRILIGKTFKYQQRDIIVHDYIITKAKKSSSNKWTRQTVIYYNDEKTPYDYDEYYFVPEEISEYESSDDEECSYIKEDSNEPNTIPLEYMINNKKIKQLMTLLENL